MRTPMQVGGVVFAIVAGGVLGGLIGWSLGDFGGRSDQESVWFVSLVVGAAMGLAIAVASILRRARGVSMGPAILIGTVFASVVAAAVFLLVVWQRRP
jgi:membrane protein YqaA with SNARE-associated domain